MVKIIFLITFIILPLLLISQNDTSTSSNHSSIELVFAVESWPEFEGDLTAFINQMIKYPDSALKDAVQGIVYITFWVDTSGATYEYEVLKGIRDDLDSEALRVASLIKFDKPAIQSGKPISVKYVLPVKFELDYTKKKEKCRKKLLH